jgi:tripartite-type tricarboxylate transporter receptor subunit TctC
MRAFSTSAQAAFFSLFALALSSGFVLADPIADFYANHLVTIAVGSDAGGTYDLYARAIARYLGKHIPGSPRVIVQNMPGAGGYTAALHVFSLAPQDGTVIGAIGSALPYQPLIDPNSPKFDVPHVNWIASVATYNIMMLVRSDVPVTSVDDLRTHPTVMATIAPGQLNSLIVAATNSALGTKIKGVNGHPGMADAMLAMQRGEVDGYPSAPIDALKRGYAKDLADGKIRLLLQFGPAPSPEFPKVPYALDLAKTPADRSLLDLAQGPLKVGYAYMLGPGVPQERIEALRAAFLATFKDPDFLADTAKQVLAVAPVTGDDLKARLAQAYQTPTDVIDRMRDLYRKLSL